MSAKPQFCVIDKLTTEACHDYLRLVTDGTRDVDSSTKVKWLLAHCHDGVTWGRLGDDQSWKLSSSAFPELSPCISAANLLELRLFGKDQEVLIWRTDEGFSGRCLIDDPVIDDKDPSRPDSETRILLGDRFVDLRDGFTQVSTARGLRQAVPLECTESDFTGGRWPLRLDVKHYFEQDDESGMVRVAVSRLVNVYKEV